MSTDCLVIENDPTEDARRLGEWLAEAGLTLRVLRPHAGDEVPDSPEGLAALVVLGGRQQAVGAGRAPWFDRLQTLLRRAVRAELPTLAICLGSQLLADAHGGIVEPGPSGPEIGPALVAKRDAAERDVLFGPTPMLPDVIEWHHDEIVDLPLGAVLLEAGSHTPVQAFRIGRAAWGLQFHIEADAAMIAEWGAANAASLAELGIDAQRLVAATAAIDDDLFESWHPFAMRFAALAKGEIALPTTRQLPLLGS